LTRDLGYYYDSSRLFFLEGASPAQIAPDGSFLLILPHTPRRVCTYKGKLEVENGSKEILFSKNSFQNNSCENAITKARVKIEGSNTRIVNLDKRKHYYTDFPSGRNMEYSFWLVGPGISNLINSDVLLTSLSSDIISNCRTIGIVIFGLYQSESVVTYGLMKNGMVQKFKCVDAVRNRPIVLWGYESCV
jgi:hypothetical protein